MTNNQFEGFKKMKKDLTFLLFATIRDENIGEKEKIITLQKKNGIELEKNRFVLEHKIENLKQQILPKDELIKELRSQIDAMEDELISVTKVQAELGMSNYYCLKVS